MKADVIKAERRVLKELGFCVHASHPHKVPPSMLPLSGEVCDPFPQMIVSFLNLIAIENKDVMQVRRVRVTINDIMVTITHSWPGTT